MENHWHRGHWKLSHNRPSTVTWTTAKTKEHRITASSPKHTNQGVPNRWNRWSMGIDGIRWQSMPINRLILIIDEQSIVQVCVIIDCHRLASIVIDCRYQSINWHRLSSIININRLIGSDFLPIFIYWLLLLIGFISVKISKGTVSWCILMTWMPF